MSRKSPVRRLAFPSYLYGHGFRGWVAEQSGLPALRRQLPRPLLVRRLCALAPRIISITSAAILFFPVTARAATYDVLACGAAPGNVAPSWSVTNSTPTKLQSSNGCGAGGTYGGLTARDVLGVPSAGNAASGVYWSFQAPTGTTLASVTYDRLLASRGDSGWLPQLRNAVGAALEDCSDAPVGSDTCTLGTRGGGSYVAIDAGGTSRLDFGLWCPTGCGQGFTLHGGEAALYRARVTVNDPTAPTASALSGPVTSGGWVRGVLAVAFTGSDGQSGVKTLRLVVDGSPVAGAVAQSCDYTQTVPCPLGPVAFDGILDTTSLTDGEHVVRGQALDASEAVGQSAPVTVRVDNGVPVSPRLAAESVVATSARRTVLVTPAPADSGSPVVARRLRVCPAGGGACVVERDLELGARAVDVDLPSDGSWVVRTWDRDEAGNEAPDSASTLTLTRFSLVEQPPAPPAQVATPPVAEPPAAPLVTPTPLIRTAAELQITSATRTRTAVRVVGRLGQGAGPVRVSLRARDAKTGRLRTLTATARARSGRWAVTLRLPATMRKAVRGRSVAASVGATSTTLAGSASRRLRP